MYPLPHLQYTRNTKYTGNLCAEYCFVLIVGDAHHGQFSNTETAEDEDTQRETLIVSLGGGTIASGHYTRAGATRLRIFP